MCPERVPHLSAVQNFLQLSLLPKGGEKSSRPTPNSRNAVSARAAIYLATASACAKPHEERSCSSHWPLPRFTIITDMTVGRNIASAATAAARNPNAAHGGSEEHERHPSAVREVVASLELAAAALHSASG